LRQRQKHQQKRRENLRGILSGFLAALLIVSAGCSDSKNTATPSADKAKQTAPQAVTSQVTLTAGVVVSEQVAADYTYDPADRRDPFAPIVNRESKQLGRSSNLPPLERYTISEFKMTGILWGGFGYNAMLEGPDGKGYFVHVGSLIGPNRAAVKKITQDSMVLEEKFKNYMGADDRREIIINLRKKQEGMQ
jgi:type IV pilus assembly protein PilP